MFTDITDDRQTLRLRPRQKALTNVVEQNALSLFSGMYEAQTLANWGLLHGEPDAIAKARFLICDSTNPPDHYSCPCAGFFGEILCWNRLIPQSLVCLKNVWR